MKKLLLILLFIPFFCYSQITGTAIMNPAGTHVITTPSGLVLTLPVPCAPITGDAWVSVAPVYGSEVILSTPCSASSHNSHPAMSVGFQIATGIVIT